METENTQASQTLEPSTLSTQEKNWAMYGHLSTFLGWIGIPLANLIAPLVIWQIKKDTMPFAGEQAKEALNFQISITIYTIISAVLTFIVIGFIGLLALLVVQIVCTIKAAIKANSGSPYHYPMTIRFIK